MINKEFDSVQFPGLTELLEESTYFNIFQDPQDKALLKALLHNSINEKVLTTNRYKFSASADFFVPNKTLYRDYVEFVKVNDITMSHFENPFLKLGFYRTQSTVFVFT